MSKPATKRPFERLAQRVFNVPLMIEPTKAEIIACALQQRLGIASFERIDGTVLEAAQMRALASEATRDYGDNFKPFRQKGSIAVIEVDGTLVHKSGNLDPWSGMTGYDGIAKKLRAAMTDTDVKAIWFDIDSPGGETSGCFALVDEIASASETMGGKPIWAYVNEQACSAAYALASVCDRIYGPADAMVGSIGCYVLHVDFSRAYNQAGLTPTMIRAGERKARGNSVEPLDDETTAKLQAWVDETRERFARYVSMGRGIGYDAVMATEADWYTAADAVRLGLMDGIRSEADAWADLERHIARR